MIASGQTGVASHAVDVLACGLSIVTIPLPHLHTVTVQLYVRAGPCYESDVDSGLSHFVEHMLFRGTERYPSSYAMNYAIEDLGGTLDAETARDYAMFQLTLAPEFVTDSIELLAELFLRPRFDDIELERQIVLEELAADVNEDGLETDASDISRRLLLGSHPLAARITGPRANVERFTRADVERHFRRLFVGNNMVLAVAGPICRRTVVQVAQIHLGTLEPGVRATSPPLRFDQVEPRFEYVCDPDQQTVVHLAFRGVAEHARTYPAQCALLRALDDGMSTPLHYRLADQLGLAYAIDASVEPLHDVTFLEIEGTTGHGKVLRLLTEILAIVREFREELVKPAVLDKAVRRYRFAIEASRDDAEAQASIYGGTLLYRAPRTDDERVADACAVTADALRDVARTVFRPERLAAVFVGRLDLERQAQVHEIVASF